MHPPSWLALTRDWNNTTLGESLGVEDANEDSLYAAMDWLFERQEAIEKQLAARHLQAGDRVLVDLSSSYFEGKQCPLAAREYSRDQKKGKLQVNYSLLTDGQGYPMVRQHIVFNRCHVTWQRLFVISAEAETQMQIRLLLRLKLNSHQTSKRLFVY